MKPLKRRATLLALILWAIVGIAVVAAVEAKAQMVCGKHTDIVGALQDGHSEYRSAVGMGGNGALVELFTNDERTWTLLMTMPAGPTCLLASGEAWETLPEQEKPSH